MATIAKKEVGPNPVTRELRGITVEGVLSHLLQDPGNILDFKDALRYWFTVCTDFSEAPDTDSYFMYESLQTWLDSELRNALAHNHLIPAE